MTKMTPEAYADLIVGAIPEAVKRAQVEKATAPGKAGEKEIEEAGLTETQKISPDLQELLKSLPTSVAALQEIVSGLPALISAMPETLKNLLAAVPAAGEGPAGALGTGPAGTESNVETMRLLADIREAENTLFQYQ